jgi:copper chaperone CopZ
MKTRFKWRRLLTNPTTHVVAQDVGQTTLKVDGLVCSSVCAVRTKQALQRLDGVERVHVDFETGIATIEGSTHNAAEYERAVTAAVAGKPLRRFIEHIHHVVRGKPADDALNSGGAR